MSRYKSTNNSLKSHLSTSSLPKEEVNIVLLGKQTVGKSALVVKYLTKRFIREYDPFLEDTYWKPDVVDQQEVLVKVMDTYGKDEKRLPYYLKWADAVLITYSITQQDSFEMALAVVLKSEGESTAVKFSCAFCETTAADDYEYVQQLFHRTVREVRKERERTLISNAIVEEPIAAEISSNTSFPSPPSSRSSNSSVHFSIPNETEKISPSTIPLPPPMPATLAHKAARAATAMKPESQPLINSSNTSSSLSSLNKTGSLPSVGSLTTLSSTTTSNPSSISSSTKRTSSKTSSVFSKIFK
ncbi:unnamed protein product [Rotaria magnacalcarata]|uniref:small monomeric GTPase n=1 Tax=Rotaria magnacalcarata TaxID=392030 RepID=A0A819PJB2_9BILA|nr:unnamed protein product [Rotaria magnacalcarata]CAF4008817.1 unnamed protein product [Rotaria magnacalcarata]CAF4118419.1 unnamed protein product [Rotaria magnacalcarata]CAF4149458.1 unnamed protein product [Rotaria magnacalcarata]CAF4426528.1 unnamed protein product [Rotaria magnacalcarata]